MGREDRWGVGWEEGGVSAEGFGQTEALRELCVCMVRAGAVQVQDVKTFLVELR